jgi:hypothetical protein
VIDANNNNTGTELKSDVTNIGGSLTTNQKEILLSERSSSLNLEDYVSKSFPALEKLFEKEKKEDICEQTNYMISQEIPRYNLEGNQKYQEKKKEININNTNIKDNNDAIEKNNDNNNNDNENERSESGLNFLEIVNGLPGWKSFVSLVNRNVDRTK